jgi:Flp pilus assembly protein TadD
MDSWALWGVRGSLKLLAAGTMLGTAAIGGSAGAQAPAGAVVQPLPRADGGAELRRHLADLGANPRSLTSLIGAGRAAIQVGDGHAALGFFARAEEIAPSDARVKAGMASAFVLLEQPQAALRFFAEAQQLGAPEVEIAGDRGLAYDMSGDQRRAQQDYALVLQRGEDSETRRRLALSQAISGDGQAALRTLDPLLRRHDRAAFRTRAFVLALTGDANGATQSVNAVMPGQGNAMAPFLSRLAALGPAQKAMAVHFGRFPSDGRAIQTASTGLQPVPGASAPARSAPAQTPSTGRRRTALAEPISDDPRRRPGSTAPATSRTAAPRPAATTPARPVQTAQAQPQRNLDIPPAMRQDNVVQPTTQPAPQPSTPRPAFSDIAELVESLPVEEPVRPAASAPRTTPATTPARTASRTTTPAGTGGRTPAPTTASRTGSASTRTAATSRTAAPRPPAHPSRHWVQIGTGQRAALGFTFNRIRQNAPDLFRNRTAHSAAMGQSSRLLVGPFATAAEARTFMNQLARQDIDAFVWTSPAGEEVTRLPAR